jgi:hypothetical protein
LPIAQLPVIPLDKKRHVVIITTRSKSIGSIDSWYAKYTIRNVEKPRLLMPKRDSSLLRRALDAVIPPARRKSSSVDLSHLTRLVRRYSVEQQQVPKDLADLVVQNYLEAVPVAPPGRRYVVDRRTVEVRLE